MAMASAPTTVKARRCGTNSNSTSRFDFSSFLSLSLYFLHLYLLKAFIRFCRLWFLLDKTRATRIEENSVSGRRKQAKPKQSSMNAGCMHKLENISLFFVFTNFFVFDFLLSFLRVHPKASIRHQDFIIYFCNDCSICIVLMLSEKIADDQQTSIQMYAVWSCVSSRKGWLLLFSRITKSRKKDEWKSWLDLTKD